MLDIPFSNRKFAPKRITNRTARSKILPANASTSILISMVISPPFNQLNLYLYNLQSSLNTLAFHTTYGD